MDPSAQIKAKQETMICHATGVRKGGGTVPNKWGQFNSTEDATLAIIHSPMQVIS